MVPPPIRAVSLSRQAAVNVASGRRVCSLPRRVPKGSGDVGEGLVELVAGVVQDAGCVGGHVRKGLVHASESLVEAGTDIIHRTQKLAACDGVERIGGGVDGA